MTFLKHRFKTVTAKEMSTHSLYWVPHCKLAQWTFMTFKQRVSEFCSVPTHDVQSLIESLTDRKKRLVYNSISIAALSST